MSLTGQCHCGQLQFRADGDPLMNGQCQCRECQFIASGGPNNFLAMPISGFACTKGKPKRFSRPDVDRPVTREFCPNCGTSWATRGEGWPYIVVKVDPIDEPASFEPRVAIRIADKQLFHNIAEGVKTFERWPPR